MFPSNYLKLFFLSLVLRLVLIGYGLWQDTYMTVKYTDIDYSVFTDAGKYVYEGLSPYKRKTYRYTPILAYLLQTNQILSEICGKLIFILCDQLTGFLIYAMLRKRDIASNISLYCTCLWLFNPLTLIVSTRGNAESFISVFILAFIYYIPVNETVNKKDLINNNYLTIKNNLLNNKNLTIDKELTVRKNSTDKKNLNTNTNLKIESQLRSNSSLETGSKSIIGLKNSKDENNLTILKPKKSFSMFNSKYNLLLSGIFYGLAVHLKIYPITYSLAIYLHLNHNNKNKYVNNINKNYDKVTKLTGISVNNTDYIFDIGNINDVECKIISTKKNNNKKKTKYSVRNKIKNNSKLNGKDINDIKVNTINFDNSNKSANSVNYVNKYDSADNSFVNVNCIKKKKNKKKGFSIFENHILNLFFPISFDSLLFFLSAAASFFCLTGYFYYRYGYEFFSETYLYHISRTDTKHNFSIYFYLFYLSPSIDLSNLLSLIVFVPQLLLLITSSFCFYRDIVMACFLQTFIFVVFNKVLTSQYFIWFFCFMPIIIPNIYMNKLKFIFLFAVWFLVQFLWLGCAYLLEFQSIDTFLFIWICGLIFNLTNCYLLCNIIYAYRYLKTNKID